MQIKMPVDGVGGTSSGSQACYHSFWSEFLSVHQQLGARTISIVCQSGFS